MTKKRLFLIGGFLAACVCLPLGIIAVMPPGPGVTKANFDRIQEGMTKPEVQAILGEGSMPSFFHGDMHGGFMTSQTYTGADGSEASIWFAGKEGHEEEGCVFDKTWRESTETPFQRICHWLHIP